MAVIADSGSPFSSLVRAWLGKLESARVHKSRFTETANICQKFFADNYDFMYEDGFPVKIAKTSTPATNFRVTLNRAFELVAIYGPSIVNRSPYKTVTPRKPMEFSPALFGELGDEQAMIVAQHVAKQQQSRAAADRVRAELMEAYLNHISGECPGGGFRQQAAAAANESLIKGRGVIWTEPYKKYGMDAVMPASTFDTVDNLLIDPDAESIDKAQWIAKRCVHPIWYVAQEYGLSEDELRGAMGSLGGMDSSPLRTVQPIDAPHARRDGQTNDLVVYYKIWSKMGVGHRLSGMPIEYDQAFENLGRSVMLVVADGVPYPLNAPPHRVSVDDADGLRRRFMWPVPYDADDMWPCTTIDYWEEPRYCWPIAPLKPGLGELMALNMIISHLVGRICKSSKDLIAAIGGLEDKIKKAVMDGGDLEVVVVPPSYGSDIRQLITFLQHPPVNRDVWDIAHALSDMFDKRVGLTDLYYGVSGKQIRTAREMDFREQAVSSRPEYMAEQVENAMSLVERKEAMCARWFTKPRDVVPLLGPTAAYMWQKYIYTTEVSAVVRELEYTVASGSARRPNKQAKSDAAMQMAQYTLATLQAYAATTGNSEPLNAMYAMIGEAMDLDVSGIKLGPFTPPPPPPGMPTPEQMEAMQGQQKLALDQQQHEMDMQQGAEAHMQKLAINAAEARQKLASQAAIMTIKAAMMSAPRAPVAGR